MKKLNYIDGLKGIGAGIVYLCHFVYAFYYAAYTLQGEAAHTASALEVQLGRTPLNLLYSGNAAVCLFLVISGFLICLSYFQTGDRGRLGRSARRRYLRLMPLILIANLLVFVLMLLGCYRNGAAAAVTGSDWFSTFNSFAPSVGGMLNESLIGCFLTGSNDYIGVLWTIPYLFWGALIVCLAAWLVGSNPFRYVAYAVMLLASLKTDVYFLPIFLGFILCDIFCTRRSWMELWRKCWILPVLSFVLGLYLLSFPSIGLDLSGTIYAPLPAAYTTLYHIAGAALLLAGILGLEPLQRFFAAKPFVWLGECSYSLYLLHFPVIATLGAGIFLLLFEIMGYNGAALITFLVTTAAVLLITWLSRRYLEPLSTLLIKRLERRGESQSEQNP